MKKTAIRAAFSVAALLVCGLTAGAAYFRVWQPSTAKPSSVRIEMTPQRVARGEYLFRLADCDGCHSERDFSRFGGPVVSTGRGKGGAFPAEMGLPGRIAASNITPDRQTGIGSWTDGEVIRAIREGVSRDNRPLFPMMPYRLYSQMSDEDVYSLVAFLKTLEPIQNPVPPSEVDFPVSLLMRSEPKPVGSIPAPDTHNRNSYGKYLATLGGCVDCHSMDQKGRPIEGMEYAGGREFRFPFARVLSANITPDLDTGIGKWKPQDFVDRFYQYRDYVHNGSPTVGPEGFTLMPWLSLCQLPPDDLRAIYSFLLTQKPVYNPVETHPARPAGRGRNSRAES